MQSHVTHILPLAKIRRYRMLPVPGTVLVRAGQNVETTDVIAEANLETKHIMLDIARGLGVKRGKSGQYIKRKIGDEVPQDGMIAERGGMGRVIRAPRAGKVVAISGGQVLLQVSNKPFQLLAGLPGTVAEVEADYGAVIEASGSWIQGIWGNDEIAVGGLTVLAKEPVHELNHKELTPNQRGSVILAGYCSDRKALEAGASNQLRGLILSSMSTSLIPIASRMPYPIIVLEGFGKLPMNETAHKLLSTSEQREVSVNSMQYNPLKGERPEIVISLESSVTPPMPLTMRKLEIGTQVRILRAPHIGIVGKISSLLPGLTRFPSGLRAPGAEIDIQDEEKAVVPLANIEVLG